ncbi:hypothetical protein GCM10009092_17360 [Bowmanella denitrificans]|uniref:Acyltransferase n=1 Tax=Bowmanella denitrificans TaxID=366582 RepID=A0ABN0X2M2_9ALTE
MIEITKLILFKFLIFFLGFALKIFSSPKGSDLLATMQYRFDLIRYKKKGVVIGAGSVLYDCRFSHSYKGDRFFIGNNCTITGTTFLGHDASPTVFMPELKVRSQPYLPGARRSYRSAIHVGDNVFIGVGTIVLAGVTIGSNVVIGAGSVVTKNVPNSTVVAGNPAKFIKRFEEYESKYRQRFLDEPEAF